MLAKEPDNERSGAGLVRTLLREQKTVAAANRANSLVAAHPASAGLLTALTEVQLSQGEPWFSKKTLERSAAVDPCLALTHLISSKVNRVDSMYSSERNEIQAAYEIDPSDAEIARAWRQSVSVAASNLDATEKLQAQVTLRAMLLGLSENSQPARLRQRPTSPCFRYGPRSGTASTLMLTSWE